MAAWFQSSERQRNSANAPHAQSSLRASADINFTTSVCVPHQLPY